MPPKPRKRPAKMQRYPTSAELRERLSALKREIADAESREREAELGAARAALASAPHPFGQALKLPGGFGIPGVIPTGLVLRSLLSASLRSMFVVDSDRGDGRAEWSAFDYAAGQPIPYTGECADRSATNLDRPGDAGLPMGQEFFFMHWRLDLSVPLEQVVMDWAAETTATFAYNQRVWKEERLVDLLCGGKTLEVPDLGVHIREHLPFGVKIQTGSPAAIQALYHWLQARENVLPPEVQEWLSTRALQRLRVSRQRYLRGWITLSGLHRNDLAVQ